tara:strand:- start:2007 stop:2675 length:669 start_codon:yes stop_codon:yes gene_type:complete
MLIDYEIIQGSEDWHKEKNGKLSGTRAKSVMIKDVLKGSIFDEIMSERNTTFKHVEGFVNDAMKRGIELEPIALKEVVNATGINFNDAGLLYRNSNHIHSPDGISDCETIGLEIKCPSAKVHNSYVRTNEIPLEYAWQIINYFAMSKDIEKLVFASYNPEYNLKPLFLLEVNRESVIFVSKKESDTINNLAEKLNNNIDYLIKEVEKEEERVIQLINNNSNF